ncbi:MAG TPA: hypothetical protein VK436_01830 [Methanocella sp.]|nr:hypothetical protein [Methanocella sp.]
MAEIISIAPLIRKVLSNPTSEQAIQLEMLRLATQNLHQPDVLVALVEVFPAVRDTEIRRCLQDILTNLDTSRFSDLEAFHNALITAFRQEKERRVRAILLERLSKALHQDTRLAPFFIEVLADPALDDQELAAATGAISNLPSVSEDVAVKALERAQSAPAVIQEKALTIAESCPRWGKAVATALVPYLSVKTDPELRWRILTRLVKARSGEAECVPVLKDILHNDPDVEMRRMALELLGYLSGRDGRISPHILWVSLYDADPELRARAVRLQREAPDLPDDQLQELARLLSSDDAVGVRLQLLDMLKPSMSKPEVRAATLSAYLDLPAAFEFEEFEALVEALAPYISRDQGLRDTLLRSWPQLPHARQRKKLLDVLLPRLKPNDSSAWAVSVFSRERNPEIRESLFERLKMLSVVKNPELARAFCAELREPGSAFRLACAQALAGAVEVNPDIVPTFEDVLLNDQERELIRTCLDGYLKPGVTRKFDVLLSVISNEALDIASRQACIDRCIRDGLDSDQSELLAEAITSSKTSALRAPI